MRSPADTTRVVHHQSIGLRWVVPVAVLLFVAGVIAVRHFGIQRELRALPEPERQALYQRTLETLRTTCARAPGSNLEDFCRAQAEFAQSFPECDGACRQLTRQFSPRPSR